MKSGGHDMVALAEEAADAEYNEVRQQVKVAIADGSWLGAPRSTTWRMGT